MSEMDSKTTFANYLRALSYARPYWGRLLVGVLAGLLGGGSLFGLLQVSENLIKPFDPPATVKVSAGSGGGPAHGFVSEKDKAKIDAFAKKFGWSVSDFITDDDTLTWKGMALTLFLAPLFVLLKSLTNYLNSYYMRWVGSRVVRDLRDALFDNLQKQSLKFYGKSDIGQLISKCTNDTSAVENSISVCISDISRAPIEIALALVFVVMFSLEKHLLGLVVLVALAFPLCIVPIIVLGWYVKKYTHRALERISDLVSRMHENFTGIKVVKAFNMEREEIERFQLMNARYFKSVVKALRAELLMTPLMESVAIILCCAFFVGCYARHVTMSQIIPIALAAIVAYRPIKRLAQLNANIQRGAAALDRIFAIIDTHDVIRESDRAVEIVEFRERISFRNVSFSYDEAGSPVVDGLNFEMPKGNVVALVGETGSGKSTMANLIARFYDPVSGQVMIDGQDLREVKISSLRKLIGIVTQETILFNDTIANNIAYGAKEATQEQIIEAARKANAHEFIMSDPAGYQRVVGEKGCLLSGGEKQRVAIARAILRNPPILILDEATSALDTVTERLVQEAIARVMEDRTVFAIAHRLSTIKHADLILVLDHGRIIERGTHDQLIAAGGDYRKLCDMQFGVT